jgi:hypothetical protein
MTTILNKLNPYTVYSSTQLCLSSLLLVTMKSIIVYYNGIRDPHLAAIIRAYFESIFSSCINLQGTCPTHSKPVLLFQTAPLTTGIAVINL